MMESKRSIFLRLAIKKRFQKSLSRTVRFSHCYYDTILGVRHSMEGMVSVLRV